MPSQQRRGGGPQPQRQYKGNWFSQAPMTGLKCREAVSSQLSCVSSAATEPPPQLRCSIVHLSDNVNRSPSIHSLTGSMVDQRLRQSHLFLGLSHALHSERNGTETLFDLKEESGHGNANGAKRHGGCKEATALNRRGVGRGSLGSLKQSATVYRVCRSPMHLLQVW